MKARPMVDWHRYGKRQIWMLFPDPGSSKPGQIWFLIEHDKLFAWVEKRHGAARRWNGAWSYPHVSKALREFLHSSMLHAT
jgi:hypothetical protein